MLALVVSTFWVYCGYCGVLSPVYSGKFAVYSQHSTSTGFFFILFFSLALQAEMVIFNHTQKKCFQYLFMCLFANHWLYHTLLHSKLTENSFTTKNDHFWYCFVKIRNFVRNWLFELAYRTQKKNCRTKVTPLMYSMGRR